jgi:hypothetical protein
MRDRLIVALLSLALFAPFLGAVRLFDWDEVNFAECSREMIATGDYMHVQIDYRPFYEKPPLFIWMQVVSMKIFGINDYAARFPNAVIGAITLVVIFSIGSSLHGRRFGWLWVLAYAGSLLPHFYFRSGIIDPLFNLFIFLSVHQLMRSLQGAWVSHTLAAGAFAACAVMTKGPVGLGLALLTFGVAWIVLRRSYSLPWKQILLACSVTIVLSSVWFLVDYLQNGPTFVMENLKYQVRLLTTGDAGHEQPFWYHPVVVLIGCFPASFFLFGGLRRDTDEDPRQRDMRIFMIVLFCVVLVVFSIVRTKIIHYSSLTYLPLTFLAACYLDRWIGGRSPQKKWITTVVAIVGTALSALIVAVLWAFIQKDWLLSLPTFRDQFLRSALQRHVAWHGWEPLTGLFIVAGAVFLVLVRNRRPLHGVVALFSGVIVFIMVALPVVAPRIEPYTQGAALDFYESQVGKDVYIQTLSFKSYAHLFYQRRPPELSGGGRGMTSDEWFHYVLEGDVDRPTYFVCKVHQADEWRRHPNLIEVRENGGFVFFRRR